VHRQRLIAVVALLACFSALAAVVVDHGRRLGRASMAPREHVARPPSRTDGPERRRSRAPVVRRRTPAIAWHASTALGTPSAGRLELAVRLPAEGEHFATWDPVRKRTPNRWWRRNGTDGLVRALLRVTERFAAAHPKAPRVLIGDLSRPHGGDFGRRFGPVGHVSHQNGLDADVYLPRSDRRERAPRRIGQVDRALAQDLVDRFVRAGAERIFVGARLRLRGPAGVVQPWPNHDDHLHVRLRRSAR
jgi:murein endopeptidase